MRTGGARSIDSGARRAPAAAMPPPSSVVNAHRLMVHRCQIASLPYTPQRNKRSTRRWRDYPLLERAALIILVGRPERSLTCSATVRLSVASIRPMRRPSVRLGCGHSLSGTTRIECQRTGMLRLKTPPWQSLPRAGGASKRFQIDVARADIVMDYDRLAKLTEKQMF